MQTPNDLLFARAVIDAKLLPKKRVDALLEEAETRETPLSEICRNRKALTPKQVQKALDAAFNALKEEDDALAGRIVERGLTDDESIKLARDEQKGSFKTDAMLPARIGEILVSMEMVTQEQLDEVLQDAEESTGTLVQESGDGEGDTFELGARATLGRFPTHEIPLRDPNASRKHARIEFFPRAKQHVLTDLGGANGTFVNDEKVTEPRPLVDGDKIRIGDTVFAYSAGAAVSPAIPSGDTRVMEAAGDVEEEEKEEIPADSDDEVEVAAGRYAAPTPVPTKAPEADSEEEEEEKPAAKADPTPNPIDLEAERTEMMDAAAAETPVPAKEKPAAEEEKKEEEKKPEKKEKKKDAPEKKEKKDADSPGAPSRMETVKRLVKNYPRELSTSIRSVKKGLGERKQLLALVAERDRLLLKLGKAALEAKIKGPETDAVRKSEEKLDTLKKRRGKKPEASIRLAEEKVNFSIRKLGRYAVRKSLKLEGDEENMEEVRKLDGSIKRLEARKLTPVQIFLREKPLLVAAGAAVVFFILLVAVMSSGGPPPLPIAPEFAVAAAARDFNPVHAWDDLTGPEKETMKKEIPSPAFPGPLPAEGSDTNRTLNFRAGQLRKTIDEIRTKFNTQDWEDTSLTQALSICGQAESELGTFREKDLAAESTPHPNAAEYGTAHAAVLAAVTTRRDIYAKRLSYLRLKKFAAAMSALRKRKAQDALNGLWAFLSYSPDEDLRDLADVPNYKTLRERALAVDAKVMESAQRLCRDLRFHAGPTTADLAILMYGAKDFGNDRPPEGISPGDWCAFAGAYTASDTGDHLLSRAGSSFAVFTTNQGLSGTPNGTPLRIVGVFGGIEQFPTAEGGTTPCPIVGECFVFKQE